MGSFFFHHTHNKYMSESCFHLVENLFFVAPANRMKKNDRDKSDHGNCHISLLPIVTKIFE